jgi:hypothetical protein
MYKIVLLALIVLTKQLYALTENEFISIVLNKHKLFLSDEIDLYLKQENLKAKQRTYYGWSFDITAKYGFEKLNAKKDNTSYYYDNNQLETDKNISLKISKDFAKGVSFSTKFSRKIPHNSYDSYRNLEHYNNKSTNLTEYNNTLETTINIPLLKNSNGGTNKLYIHNAAQDKTIEELQLLESKEDILEDKLKDFIELATSIDQVKVATTYLTTMQNLLNIVEKSAKNDNKLVHNGISKAQRVVDEYTTDLKNMRIQLFSEIGNIDIEDIDFNYNIRSILVKDVKNYISQYSRDLKISHLEIIKKQAYIKHYKNQALPDFDVNIWATNTRNKGNYSYYSYYDKNDFGVSLEFEYPLGGNSSNEYNLLEAELGLKKQYIDYQDDTHDLIEDIQELQEELLLYAKNIDSFTLEIQNTSVENERDNYQKGNGDIKFVLDEIIDFYNLQFDYLDEQKQYHQARIEYDSKLDRLIDSRIKCDFCQSNLRF